MAECEWIVLCDSAFPDAKNKLCLIGIFDAITGKEVPVTHERAHIAFSIIGEPGEVVQMKVEIIGPLGQPVGQAKTLTFTLPDQGAARGSVDVRSLVFTDFGRHAINVDVGDGSPKSAWFTLLQHPPES